MIMQEGGERRRSILPVLSSYDRVVADPVKALSGAVGPEWRTDAGAIDTPRPVIWRKPAEEHNLTPYLAQMGYSVLQEPRDV